jgi:potassium uptake TrkH family protein
MINFLKRVRERVNLFLYDSQERVLGTLQSVTFLISVASLWLLIYYYGFPVSEETRSILINVIKGLFMVYILNYGIRFFYAFKHREFLKRNWIESTLIFMLVVDIISVYIFDFYLLEVTSRYIGIQNFNAFYIVFLQLYIMVFVGIELVHVSQSVLRFQLRPGILFLLSYLIIIVFGTILLLLPEMTVKPGSMRLIDALFTATSAVCVTGLTVVDTATYFTTKGHLVIMILIQLGGIGIITFASFFALYLKRGFGIKHQTALQDLFAQESALNAVQLLRQVILYTIIIESIGAIMIFSLWGEMEFASLGEKLFVTAFHAVSAFCNAGFSIFPNGLMQDLVRANYVLHMAFAFLIVVGGIGFPVIKDLFSLDRLRERLKLPWKGWKTSTTIAVYATGVLLLTGTVLFFALENSRYMGSLQGVEKIVTSFFMAATARTAGFSTVNISELAMPSLILFMFLMFVGASSGSTGGGIKTSTFVVIMTSVYATIRGKKHLEIARRSISSDLVKKALSIVVLALFFIFATFFLLALMNPGIDPVAILFESVSAVSTVGLSMGITAELNEASRLVLIIFMYAGRVGSLTLAFALSSPVKIAPYKYPSTHILVG